jgi:hypothetical protein
MSKQMAKPPLVRTPDQELAEHLAQAEEHLIAAVELFLRKGKGKPERNMSYQRRLRMAQEMVTALFREELVRIRGPIKIKVK